MKIVLLSFAVLCAIACTVEAILPPNHRFGGFRPGGSTGPTFPRQPVTHRFRREEPQRFGGFPSRSTGPTFPRPPVTHRFRREEPYRFGGFPAGSFPGSSTGPTFPRPPVTHRFRREEPQGSIMFEGRQPLDGPDRRPSIDLNYNQRLIDNGKTTLDAFGGAKLHESHVAPQVGLNYEHKFNNDMFIRGQGHLQQGPHGRISPGFGADFGWRFRREAVPYDEEEVAEAVY